METCSQESLVPSCCKMFANELSDSIFYFIWSDDVAADYSIWVKDVTDGEDTLKLQIFAYIRQ